MATQKLNSFTLLQLTEAVSQILSSANFWVVNSHVPIADRAQVRTDILRSREWPTYPLFSPYAKTHDGYSQGEFLAACPNLKTNHH